MTFPSSGMFDRGALPRAEDFYRSNLEKFRRIGRHKAVALCPFHPDHNPSLSIDLRRGLFYCFGCAAGGDIIRFVEKRDGVKSKTAAKILGILREDLSPAERRELRRLARKREKQRAELVAHEEQERHERIDARDHLHAVETLYDEAVAEHDWLSMAELLPRVRVAEERFWQVSGFEVRHEH